MKYCVHCGKELKQDAKFCNGCGSQQMMNEDKIEVEEELIAPRESSKNKRIKKKEKETTETSITENQTLEHISKHSKNYFTYLNKNVISPEVNGNTDSSYFGIVNFIIMTVLSGLTISHMIAEAASPVFSLLGEIQGMFNNGYGNTGYMTGVFPFAFKLILLFACLYFSFVIVIYLFKLIFGQVKPNFLSSFNDLFSPASLGVYTSIIVFILSFIVNATSLILILGVWIPLFLLSATFIGLLWKTKIKIQQRYYVVIGTMIVGFIINLIFIAIGANLLG